MQCTLHIGSEKTGTTSIQRFISEHHHELSACGLFALKESGFPNVVRIPLACMNYDRNNHATIKLGLNEDIYRRKLWCSEIRECVRTEILKHSKDYKSFLISSEYFSSKLVLEEEVARVKELLIYAGITEFKVVLYLRNQLEFQISRQSTSMVASTIFAGISNVGDRPLLDVKNWLLDYESLISRWSSVFDESSICIRLFDREELYNGNVVQDFFSKVCGLDLSPGVYKDQHTENKSLSAIAQKTIYAVNECLDCHSVDVRVKNAVRKKVLDLLFDKYIGQPITPTRDECIEFQSNFNSMNRRLSERWFDGREILAPDFQKYPECNDHLKFSFDDGISILVEMLLRQNIDCKTA